LAEYIPSSRDWVREQVTLYEGRGGTKGTSLRDTGLPVIIVIKTGGIRKTPVMRVKDGANYVPAALGEDHADDPALRREAEALAAGEGKQPLHAVFGDHLYTR
jgi:hypothetical protein